MIEIPVLFFGIAPLLGILTIIEGILCFIGIFTIDNTLIVMAIYSALGTVYMYWIVNKDEEMKYEEVGIPGKSFRFHRQKEWDSLQQYYRDCKEYEDWLQRTKRDFWESLNGFQFECEVTDVFTRMGYHAWRTPGSNDGGVDIILTKGSERIAVQCKAYKAKISPSVARELYGVMASEKYTSGIIATLNGASSNTIEFCKNKPIKIIDADDLIKMQG